MNKNKNKNGITLIALIVTIVILLILATVTLAEVRNTELFNRAKTGTRTYGNEQNRELEMVEGLVTSVDNWSNVNNTAE